MAAETMSWKQFTRKLKSLNRVQTLLITAAVTLLPIVVGLLLWSRLPGQFDIYLDSDTRPDLVGATPLAVFLPPILLLGAHLVLACTAKGGTKPWMMNLRMWILPILSNLMCYMTFALAMGAMYSVLSYTQLILGLLLVFVGGYMPRLKAFGTVGIRAPWAFTSRHNWWATHRFGGYCWTVGGLLMAMAAFVPNAADEQIMVGLLLAIAVLPVAFSYVYYLRQKAKGDPLHRVPKLGKGGILVLVAVLIVLAVTMCTGSLRYDFRRDCLEIKASYYDDFTVPYSKIQSLEYHEGDVEGNRIGGFVSLRLKLGYFNREETDTYTRYTYQRPEACVLVQMTDRLLVISGKNAAETREIYDTLRTRIAQ